MAMQTDSYMDAKVRQLDEHSTYRLLGQPIESDLGEAAHRWKPVWGCLCVQDLPEHPCHCPPVIWWLPIDKIFAEGESGQKDHQGAELRYFDMQFDAKLLVESVKPVSVSSIKEATEWIRANEGGGDAQTSGGGGGPRVALNPAAAVLGFLSGVLAGVLGNAIYDGLTSDGNFDDLPQETKDAVCWVYPRHCQK